MSPRERKTREQRAAETQAILDEVDASRAASGEDRGLVADVGRGFVEETVWLLIQVAIFLVPCALGLLLGGGFGLAVGFGVGVVMLGVFWIVVTVTGIKGVRAARREARRPTGG